MFERRPRSLNPYSRMALAVRGWGFEALLALSVFLTWRMASGIGGPGLAVLVLGSAGIILWRSPSLHRRLVRKLRSQSTRRWFNRVLVSCEVISRHGRIPKVLCSEAILAGQRLRLQMPAGFNTEIIDEATSETLAATIGAREVRVLRNPENASMAHLSIIMSNALSAPAPPWPGPTGSQWDPISLGVDEDGSPVCIGLPELNPLLGGEPGAGKSAALSLLIAAGSRASADPVLEKEHLYLRKVGA